MGAGSSERWTVGLSLAALLWLLTRWSPTPLVAVDPLAAPTPTAPVELSVTSTPTPCVSFGAPAGCLGAPVLGAEVTVLEVLASGLAPRAPVPVEPGAAARLAVGTEPLLVLIDAPGRARAVVALEPVPGQTLVVGLAPASPLAVRVVDESGAPLADADVWARCDDGPPFGAVTGDDGVARLDRLPNGRCRVRAYAVGYEPAEAEADGPELTLTLPKSGALEVRVELPDGRPAGGAMVHIAGEGVWPPRSAPAGPSGVLRIEALPRGAYDLRATSGELSTPRVTPVELTGPAGAQVTLRLAPGRFFTVLVTDGPDEGAWPVADADVVLAEDGLGPFPLRGRTNAEGLVTLGPLAGGEAFVSASADGFVPRGGVVLTADAPPPFRVALVRGGTICGKVVDADGFEIEGASIELTGADLDGAPFAWTPQLLEFQRVHFDWALTGPRTLIPAGELGVMPGPVPPIPGIGALSDAVRSDGRWVTDALGEFCATPAPPGTVYAVARHPDHVEGWSEPVALAAAGEAYVRIVLRVGATLSGRVFDEAGLPVEGAFLRASGTGSRSRQSAMTEPDGSYLLRGLPEHVWLELRRTAGDPVALEQELRLKPGEERELDLTLPAPLAPLRVTLVAEGEPVPGARVAIRSLRQGRPREETAFTDDAGVALFDDAATLDFRLEVEASGFAPVERELSPAPEQLTVELRRGVILAGTVTTVRGRRYVGGARVTVRVGTFRRSTHTDEVGHFELRDAPTGAATLEVTHPELAPAERTFRVSDTGHPERPQELGSIDLAEPATLVGRVVDAEGAPVRGARVAVGGVARFVAQGAVAPSVAVTDADGRFRLERVASGTLELVARALDGRTGRRELAAVPGDPTDAGDLVLSDALSDDEPTADGPERTTVAVTLEDRELATGRAVLVTEVDEGTEAWRAGLRPRDLLARVAEQPVTDRREARRLLDGPAGSVVVLVVLRDGERLTLPVPREVVR